MRIFVAGATGAVGRAMTPQLLSAGHDVTAITRDAAKAAALERQGVDAVVCDVFDNDTLIEAVRHAAPDAVIHQLTDLPAAMDPRNIDDLYARNDRVRREGTRNLLEAARLASVPRFVLQSMGTWYRPEGSSVKAEQDPLWIDAPEPIGTAVRTVADMETLVTEGVADGVVLRYGAFYGPGTWYAPDGAIAQMMRRRLFPMIGRGDGITSFVHVDDAASAAVAALTAPRGVYNVADDEPARASEWMPIFAAANGAPPPRSLPQIVVRLFLGKALTEWVATMRGASAAKMKASTAWRPRYPSWRTGFHSRELSPP